MMEQPSRPVNHDPGPVMTTTFMMATESEDAAADEEDDPIYLALKNQMSQLQICSDSPMDGSLLDSVFSKPECSSVCPSYCIMNPKFTDDSGPSTIEPLVPGSPLLASKIQNDYLKIKAKEERQIEHQIEPVDCANRRHCMGMKCDGGGHGVGRAHSDDETYSTTRPNFYEGLFSYSSDSEIENLFQEGNHSSLPPPSRCLSPATSLAITFGCLELSNSMRSVTTTSTTTTTTRDYRPHGSCRVPPRPTIDANFLRQLRDYLVMKKRDYIHMLRYKQVVAMRIDGQTDLSTCQNRRYLRKMATKATKLKAERTRELVRRRQLRGLGLGPRVSLDREPSPPPPSSITRGGATCQRSKMFKKVLPRKRV